MKSEQGEPNRMKKERKKDRKKKKKKKKTRKKERISFDPCMGCENLFEICTMVAYEVNERHINTPVLDSIVVYFGFRRLFHRFLISFTKQ